MNYFSRQALSRAAISLGLGLCISLSAISPVQAERIKDIATLQGVRNNPLIGYGLVVGLDGTGDQTTQAPFTGQSLINMLAQLGVQLPPGQTLQLKNIAAVVVTAVMPPFARPGQQIDVTVSSIGNAKSLRGGTLLMTPLKGADSQIYAVAQGNLLVGGASAGGEGGSVQVNHLSAGRISMGASIERIVPTALGQGDFAHFELQQADFGTAQRVTDAINSNLGPGTAQAMDGRQIRVRMPTDMDQRVAFLGNIENLDVISVRSVARVIINPRTGSIVMNQDVSISNCAVAHGSLTVTVSNEVGVSQPAPLSGGTTAVTNTANVELQQAGGSLMNLRAGANLAEVVKALNAIGAKPLDMLAILQAMKAAGALKAELEII